jgi:hypothetical protein
MLNSYQATIILRGDILHLDGAVILHQGVIFAIVIVESHFLSKHIEREQFRYKCSSIFPNMPIVLMAKDLNGVPTYHGSPSIIKTLDNFDISRVTWKRYKID